MNRMFKRWEKLAFYGFALLMLLIGLAGKLAHAEPRVIAGFTACHGKECRDFELIAPTRLACEMQAQMVIAKFLRDNNMSSWTLKGGWRCYIGVAGPTTPA